MSELYDEEAAAPPPQASGRGRALAITAGVLIATFFALSGFANLWTDRLWFRSVGYSQVFSTLLLTRIGMFLVFGLLLGGVVALNIVLAYRARPLFALGALERSSLDRYREAVTPARTWLVLAVAAVLTVFSGASAAGQWRTFLLWRHRVVVGTDDPYFGKDLGFYLFSLPWWHFLVDFALATLVLAVLGAVLTHYLYGGIRLQGAPEDRFTGFAQGQVSLLLGLLVLVKAGDFYLDRFDLTTRQGSLFTGMNYTADNAVLPAKNILIGIAVVCALLFLLNVWRRTWELPTLGVGLMALSSVLLGLIWPAVVQQFQVNPSEADKEAPYIAKNIASTRDAYDLTDVETVPYTDSSPAAGATAAGLTASLASVPLVDPKLVRDTFENIQQGRAYYSVAPVLDVDHYQIDGTQRALVLGARELDQAKINAGDQNWSNLHTVYTHGSGIIAAFANQRPADDVAVTVQGSADKNIYYAEGLDPGQDALSQSMGGFQGDIYFGEESPDYSIVGKAKPEDPDVELGLGRTDDGTDPRSTYDGSGGVDIGGTFNRLMYALKYGEPNFLLSQRVNENSKILYIRNPTERAEKVAPWLTFDSDAYPVVVDGKVEWVLDGYTTSDLYPGSQKESFADMTDDSLQTGLGGLPVVPTDEINYMRNTVKATVDAYDGTVTLYAWDEDEPLLQAWQKVFPDVVKPRADIPPALLEHLRYPEDLFKVQRYQFAKYHVTDPSVFYQGNNRWEVPADPNAETHQQPPFRLFAERDGRQVWSLTSTFTPYGKPNLAAYLAVDSDPTSEGYGKLQVLELADQGADGPGLISTQIQQDQDVRDALLPYTQSGSPPRYGNLLTLPVDDGFVYIQPVYAVTAGSSSSYPILQYVVTSYGGEVGIGKSLGEALADSLGAAVPDEGTGDGNGTGNGTGNGGKGSDLPVNQQIRALLTRADAAFAAAQTALADGDLAAYQKQTDRARTFVQRALDLAASRGNGEPSASPSADPSASPSAGPSDSSSASPSPSASTSAG